MEKTITLDEKQAAFIKSIMTDVVPGMSIPAKDAAAILEIANSIAEKLK